MQNVDALDSSLFGSKKSGPGSASKVGGGGSVSQKPPLTSSAKGNGVRSLIITIGILILRAMLPVAKQKHN